MAKFEIALAAACSMVLLTACGSKEAAPPGNSAVSDEAAVSAEPSASEPAVSGGPNASAPDESTESVPPPDAVSHPDGFLPPAPADPQGNASAPGAPPPATEDQYIRNGQ